MEAHDAHAANWKENGAGSEGEQQTRQNGLGELVSRVCLSHRKRKALNTVWPDPCKTATFTDMCWRCVWLRLPVCLPKMAGAKCITVYTEHS